jgi:hypothetical protein
MKPNSSYDPVTAVDEAAQSEKRQRCLPRFPGPWKFRWSPQSGVASERASRNRRVRSFSGIGGMLPMGARSGRFGVTPLGRLRLRVGCALGAIPGRCQSSAFRFFATILLTNLPDEVLPACSSNSNVPLRAYNTRFASKAEYSRPCSSRRSKPTVTRQLRQRMPLGARIARSLCAAPAISSGARCMMTVSQRTLS